MLNDVELFNSGCLNDAIARLSAFVKENPSNIELRSRLVEYLCVSNHYEKADKQLETIALLDPNTSVRVLELRQILRAAKARADLWEHGRPPDFLNSTSEKLKDYLRLIVLYRDSQFDEMLHTVDKMNKYDLSPIIINGDKIEIFRDMDDFTSGIMEVYTALGKYVWILFEDISEMSIALPRRAIDIAWTPAELTLRDGTTGVVHVPNIYPLIDHDAQDQCLMGKKTDWVASHGFYRGRGLKCFMADNNNMSLHEINIIKSEDV